MLVVYVVTAWDIDAHFVNQAATSLRITIRINRPSLHFDYLKRELQILFRHCPSSR